MQGPEHSVGIFGGSFNPPHMGHILATGWALSIQIIQEVWVIPAGGHPFGKELVPLGDRMEMCRRAFNCFGPRVSVLDSERGEGVHYSIDTLRKLIEEHPGILFRWIVGSDAIGDAPRWKQYDELTRLAPPIIIPRLGHSSKTQDEIYTGEHCDDFVLPDLSSTWIRHKINSGESDDLEGLVPATVIHWITEKGLYGKQPSGAGNG